MAKTDHLPVSNNTLDRFFTAVISVMEKQTRRIEVHMEIDGKKYLAVVYRLNEQVPVRVDFKAS